MLQPLFSTDVRGHGFNKKKKKEENLGLFRFVSVCFETVQFVSVVSI
jgi:hypothetical protein